MNYFINFFFLLSNLKKILFFHHICTLKRELNVAAQRCRISTPALVLLMSTVNIIAKEWRKSNSDMLVYH